MRVVDPMSFLGADSGLREARLTKAECSTLLRAADIMDRLYELATRDYDPNDEEMDLALGSCAVREIAEEGKLDLVRAISRT